MAGAKSGEYSRFLSFHGRNPDVLNSIANLSNDEVFTPPEFANRMLDTLENAWAESNNGENIWSNPDLKFLDPFTKSGVFLREIATRLIKGLESEIPDLQSRVDHILTKQVFGIATTHLTSLMARRSLYCSKKANGKHSITKEFKDEAGNIWFQPMSHTWKKGTIRELTMDESGNEVERYVDGKCEYCGASKRDFEREEGLELHAYGLIHQEDPKKWVGEIFGQEMQFDVIIGNPPYQLDDGGFGSSAAPIYQHFVEQALQLKPKYLSVVIPSRWFAGGKGLSAFRKHMLSDKRISHLVDYLDSSEVFPGVTVRGGICYFLWNSSHTGLCLTETHFSEHVLESERSLLEPGLDVYLRFATAANVLRKVAQKFDPERKFGPEDEISFPSFSTYVSPRKPFGFPTNFKGDTVRNSQDDLVVFQNGGKGFVPRSSVHVSTEAIDKWKVFLSYASTGSDDYPHTILGRPFVGKPGEVCTETYIFLGPFETENEATNAMSFLLTKFFRFLVLLRKASQHATQTVYGLVPLVPLTKEWSDEDLIAYFDLSEADLELINSLVRPLTPQEDK